MLTGRLLRSPSPAPSESGAATRRVRYNSTATLDGRQSFDIAAPPASPTGLVAVKKTPNGRTANGKAGATVQVNGTSVGTVVTV